MSLLDDFAQPCVLMEKKRVTSSEGGWTTTWEEGLSLSTTPIWTLLWRHGGRKRRV